MYSSNGFSGGIAASLLKSEETGTLRQRIFTVLIFLDNRNLCRYYSRGLNPSPDLGFFRRQAEESGFDEPSYLDAVAMVPVVTEEKVRLVMGFLCRLAHRIRVG